MELNELITKAANSDAACKEELTNIFDVLKEASNSDAAHKATTLNILLASTEQYMREIILSEDWMSVCFWLQSGAPTKENAFILLMRIYASSEERAWKTFKFFQETYNWNKVEWPKELEKTAQAMITNIVNRHANAD